MREWLERMKQGLDLPPAPEPYDGNLAPIYTCAAAGRRDAIERLLWAGWDVNEGGEGFRAALAFPEMREFLLERGARVDVPDCHGQTLLFEAVLRKDLNRVESLLELGAEVDHADQEGRTPLWIAANRNRLPILERLLEAGANPNHPDLQGVIPLMKAATRAVQLVLLQAGARTDLKDGDGRSLFQHYCNRREALEQLIGLLPEKQVPVEFRLWYLFRQRARARFEQLALESLKELSPDRPVVHSQSVLWWAARLGSPECCRQLCERGWSPLRRDRDKRTPLHVAIESDRPKVIQVLLRSCAKQPAPAGLAESVKNPRIRALPEFQSFFRPPA